MQKEIEEQIASTIINVLIKRFETFPEDASNNRNAPFHEAFLEAFGNKLGNIGKDIPYFISLSSWLHGLNTTLGQSFFEKIAHILSSGEKREYTSKKKGNLSIPLSQKNKIDEIVTQLSNGKRKPNITNELQEILKTKDDSATNVQDFSADVFIENNASVTAIELKTVKPNSSNMISEKRKIMEGRIALKHHFEGKKVNFYLGFPFDPTSNTATGYDKSRFLNSIIGGVKFFSEDEILLSAELWDLLSGKKNTMKQLLAIINAISNREFIEKYKFLNNPSNRNKIKYKQILQEWCLHTEIKILAKEEKIVSRIINDNKLQAIFNSEIIKSDGYNWNRKKLLDRI